MNNQSQPVTKIAALIELESDDKVDFKISGGNAKENTIGRDLDMNMKISPRQHEGEHTKAPTKYPETPSPSNYQLYHDIMSSPPSLTFWPPGRVLNDATLFAQIPFPILPDQEGSQSSYTFRKRARTICGSSSPPSKSDSGTNKRSRRAACSP